MLRVLVTVGSLATIVAWSGDADAKKAKKLKMDPTVPETPEPTGPVAPEADAAGHVNFGNPQAEGLGRVTVKSESGDKIQVYLDGRYFGPFPTTSIVARAVPLWTDEAGDGRFVWRAATD